MIEWRDPGFVLTARPHGESAQIVELLTREHGRHLGLVRGGQSPRLRGILQPGNEVAALWRGRLAEHLGTLACELLHTHFARLIDEPDRLAGLAAAAALLSATLPEREPHPDVFAAFAALIEALEGTRDWQARYVLWERDLLAALGFGLDLSCCAATGVTTDLAYVSPKSGRAVSRSAGLPYHDRLLPLPAFLWRAAPAAAADLAQGLELTGYFLMRHLLSPQRRSLPPVRARLLSRLKDRTRPPELMTEP
jgi:DNA repair protein RecO (recombination protein O)